EWSGERTWHAVEGERREDVSLLVSPAGDVGDVLERPFERVVIGVGDIQSEDRDARLGQRGHGLFEVAYVLRVRSGGASDRLKAPAEEDHRLGTHDRSGR